MADVTLGYLPTDGAALDVDGLNQDLYDLTPSISLYETANGKIELANFAAGFRVQSWHIQPGATNLTGFAGQIFSADYFQDAWGTGEVFKPVAGACMTFKCEGTPNLAFLFASLFCTTWRQPGPISAGAGTWTGAPDVVVRMFIDGTEVNATLRPLPQTVFYDGAAVPIVNIFAVEPRLTRHFNLHIPKLTGGTTPFDPLTEGWHSFGIAIYIAYNTEGSDTADVNDRKEPLIRGVADARPLAWYHAMHRVKCYVRSAGYVALL